MGTLHLKKLFDFEKVLKEYLKGCNDMEHCETGMDIEPWSNRIYFYPFKIELTYRVMGSSETKKYHFYIVKSNTRRGVHYLQEESQRLGKGTEDRCSLDSVWQQSYEYVFQSRSCKGTRGRIIICDKIFSSMGLYNKFDSDDQQYIIDEIKGIGFENPIEHIDIDEEQHELTDDGRIRIRPNIQTHSI